MTSNGGEQERGFTLVDSPDADEAADSYEAAGIKAPAPDFSTFVLSLGTSALYHLALVDDPESGASPVGKNLPLARQAIDTLAMIEDKTRGNLEPDEEKLLASVLYELRVKFVEGAE